MSGSLVSNECAQIVSELRALTKANAPALRAVRKRWSKALADRPGRDVIALADSLLDSKAPGRNVIAHDLICNHDGAFQALRLKDVERLGRYMNSWSDADVFACYVSGPAWRNGRISDKAVHRWTQSDDRWWRRTALVSTVPLNVKAQGRQGDAKRTLAVCALLVDDRDDMVVKALSWALRALAERDPKPVERFVKQHNDRLAARVRREVRNKLRTGLKNPK